MTDGVDGTLYMVSVLLPLLPKQFTDFTARVPLDVNEAEKLITTELVPCPLTILALAGAVHW